MYATNQTTNKLRIVRNSTPENILYLFDGKDKPKDKPKKPKRTLQHTAADPIKDLADIEAAKQYFLNYKSRYVNTPINLRNYALFVLSINCARRIGDILPLTVGEVMSSDGEIVNFIVIREGKTNKRAKVFFSPNVKEALKLYLDTRPNAKGDEPLFISRQGNCQPLKYVQALNTFKKMAKEIGLTDRGINVTCHTTRKSWAYHSIMKNRNDPTVINRVQKALNHDRQRVTLDYVGIGDEEMEELYNSVNL